MDKRIWYALVVVMVLVVTVILINYDPETGMKAHSAIENIQKFGPIVRP